MTNWTWIQDLTRIEQPESACPFYSRTDHSGNVTMGYISTCLEQFLGNGYSSILRSEQDGSGILDFLFLSLKFFLIILWRFLDLVLDKGLVLVYVVLGIAVLWFVYKSVWSPINYTKDLTDVGFKHLGKGRFHAARVQRARQARRLGTKLPPPYPDGWFAILESDDLKAGEVKQVDCLGENLAVYRTSDGQVRCVDAYCPHLGANMAAGGAVVGGCLECPFHRWRFDGESGACVGVPGRSEPPRGVGVHAWTVQELNDAIWIWHSAERKAPSWFLKQDPNVNSAWWACRGRNEYLVNSHVQDIPENGADVAHLNAIHSMSLFGTYFENYPIVQNLLGCHNWSAEWSAAGAARGQPHIAEMKLRHDYCVLSKFQMFGVDILAEQVGPGYVSLEMKTGMGPLMVLQFVTPVGPLLQRVVHRLYSPLYNAPIVAALTMVESYMFERDVAIWNLKTYVSNPSYVKTDKTIRAFRTWYSQFYSESSIPFEQAVAKVNSPLDW